MAAITRPSITEKYTLSPGVFDGRTILRYTHSYLKRSSGGVEQCLRGVNRGLLQRHRLTVLQTHLVEDLGNYEVEVEEYGLGRIFWIPVAVRQTKSRFADIPLRARFILDQTLASSRQNGNARHPLLHAIQAFALHRFGHLWHKCVIVNDTVPDLLQRHNVDLLAIHWMTYDAERLIQRAKKAGIPFVIANHFDNGLFLDPRMRKWLPHSAGVGAVSPKGIPPHVAGRCVNLLDGIDTEFFAPENARPLPPLARPLILLPALVKESKGQYDLLQAARILASRNVDFEIRFAGAIESDSLYRRLQEYASTNGLVDRIAFLGEIDQTKIRDWYAASTVVVLPTHWEGLGRCLAEAQAMEKPVVAYDSGGVAETVLPNETGFLVKTGDVEDLAKKIGFLLANQTERRRMARRGREFVVEKFSLAALIDRHERFYFKALQG